MIRSRPRSDRLFEVSLKADLQAQLNNLCTNEAAKLLDFM
jgi:hypothetical protein